MSGDDDRPGWLDREKRSFSDLDRARREKRDGRAERPRSAASQARAKQATKQYLDQIEGLFQAGVHGEADALGRAVLDARGTPALADACRAYRDAVGVPSQARLVSCFLDTGDRELVLAGLEALLSAQAASALDATAGLRTQLRSLAEDSDDEIAGTAEELLEAL